MGEKKRVGNFLVLSGAVTSLVAVLIDYIGIDHTPGLGKVQLIVLAVGVLDVAVGLFLRRGEE
jgi:hypothetical protein